MLCVLYLPPQVRSDDSRRSNSVHQLTLAALGLQAALHARRGIGADVALVMRAAQDDHLVNMITRTIPPAAISRGVASLHDLQVCVLLCMYTRPPLPCLAPQCAFDAVAAEGRRVSFVPRQGGVLAEAVGSFLALIPEFTVNRSEWPVCVYAFCRSALVAAWPGPVTAG